MKELNDPRHDFLDVLHRDLWKFEPQEIYNDPDFSTQEGHEFCWAVEGEQMINYAILIDDEIAVLRAVTNDISNRP